MPPPATAPTARTARRPPATRAYKTGAASAPPPRLPPPLIPLTALGLLLACLCAVLPRPALPPFPSLRRPAQPAVRPAPPRLPTLAGPRAMGSAMSSATGGGGGGAATAADAFVRSTVAAHPVVVFSKVCWREGGCGGV